jgi:hypothetical protein
VASKRSDSGVVILNHCGAVGMSGFDRPENHIPPPSAAPPSQAAPVGKSEYQDEQTRQCYQHF